MREASGANALYRRYFYGIGRLWMSTLENNSNAFYFHYDPLGSVRNITAQGGATQWTYDYEPYGATRTQTGSTPTNLMKFTGEYEDPTGLYYLRARQYDPTVGRFLQPDPVDPGVRSPFVARYVYVADRPTMLVDPSGEVMRPVRHGVISAQLAAEAFDWQEPYSCQAVSCGGRPKAEPSPRLVHPLPRGIRYWGGTRIHPTDGIPGYPALDFGAGRTTRVVAVERGYIRANSSADVGGAFYMRGESGLDYWYGHITPTVSRGQMVRAGQTVGRIVRHPNGDHLHLGANANFGGKIIDRRRRAGTDDKTHPTWRTGVLIMRQINRAPRVS